MKLPPGPNSIPALTLLRWMRSPFRFMEESRKEYGDTFTMILPGRYGNVVMVSDPAAVKEVFALGAGDMSAAAANIVLKPFLGNHSLLLLDGAEHARHRKMIVPAFHGERMLAYGQAMLDLAHASIDGWPLGRRFPVHRPMQAITLDVIVRTVFGVAAGPRSEELRDLLKETLDASAWPGLLMPLFQRDLGPYSPWGRWTRLRDRASALVRAEIRQSRADGTRDGRAREDILALMLAARDEHGRPLEEDEIHDELITLLVAGHETTATSLAWALRWIIPDRDLTGKLREEIATANGDPAKIAKLELLDGAVREALRLQPVIPLVGRVLHEDTKIGSWTLPARSLVAPSVYLVHRDPDLYENPSRFEPERFVRKKPAAWEWIPFGGGLRRCVGAAFAIYEMKMVLAAVLSRVDLALPSPESVRVVRRSITMTPSDGLPVIATARRSRERSPRAA